MKKQAGIWIDHKQAFIVVVGEGTEQSKRLDSDVEKHVRFSGHAAQQEGSADDQRDRQFASHLGKYYDEVIAQVHDAQSILLFGPGEAKGELEKRFAGKGLTGSIVGVETADKMTEHQIAAKVRQYFQK